jgi:hypothetical protein
VAVYEAHALRDLLLSLRARLDAEPQLTAGVASGVMTREELLGAWQVSYNLLADQLAVDDPTRFRPVRFFTGPSAELAED